MSLKALAHKVLERQRHVHSAEKRREQAPERSDRRCSVCGAVLSDDSFLATWTGANCCPTGPCLQRALDAAEDDLETPDAVARYAKELADE